MLSKGRFLVAIILLALPLMACQSTNSQDKGHSDTVKAARDFYNAIYARDFEGAIRRMSCLSQQIPDARIGPTELQVMQRAFPWQNLKLEKVTELDYSADVSHLQLQFSGDDGLKTEGITLNKADGK